MNSKRGKYIRQPDGTWRCVGWKHGPRVLGFVDKQGRKWVHWYGHHPTRKRPQYGYVLATEAERPFYPRKLIRGMAKRDWPALRRILTFTTRLKVRIAQHARGKAQLPRWRIYLGDCRVKLIRWKPGKVIRLPIRCRRKDPHTLVLCPDGRRFLYRHHAITVKADHPEHPTLAPFLVHAWTAEFEQAAMRHKYPKNRPGAAA